MAENINLNKSVFNKRDYTKTINTSFSELGVKTIQEQIDEVSKQQGRLSILGNVFLEKKTDE